MPHGIRRWVLGLMATGLTTLTLTAAEPEAFLPKFGAVKVDGDLSEWNAAVTVPVRFASCIAQSQSHLERAGGFRPGVVLRLERRWTLPSRTRKRRRCPEQSSAQGSALFRGGLCGDLL
jgi:hypothetical protein